MGQKIELSVPLSTSPRGQLFFEFAARMLGPNGNFWGKIMTKEEVNQLHTSFNYFYDENYQKRNAKDHFHRLQREDLTEVLANGLYVRLINRASKKEEAKIDVFFENLNTFLLRQSSFQGLQRHPNPPLDAYEHQGHSGKVNSPRNW